MLSSFIHRNTKYSKRRGKKQNLNVAIRRIQSPPSPGSFMSPEIVDINEKSFDPMGRAHSPPIQDEEESYESYDSRYDEEGSDFSMPRSNPNQSPHLELDIPTEPLTDWFTHDTLRMETRGALVGGSYERMNHSGSVNGRIAGGTRREVFALSSEEAISQQDEVRQL